jgi:energy-coupling factor transport system substrate-specific component
MKEKEGVLQEFSVFGVALIILAIGINWVGGWFAATLKLPVWLDTIGTMLVAVLVGPWAAAVAGGLTNLIKWATFDPVAGPYAIVNIAIGLVTGYLYRIGFISLKSDWKKIAFAGFLIAIVATVLSVPITVMLFGGVTGSGADAVAYIYLGFQRAEVHGNALMLWIAVALGEFVTDFIDKILSLYIILWIANAMPKKYIG